MDTSEAAVDLYVLVFNQNIDTFFFVRCLILLLRMMYDVFPLAESLQIISRRFNYMALINTAIPVSFNVLYTSTCVVKVMCGVREVRFCV